MIRLLADENISPETVRYMRDLGYDIVSAQEAGLAASKDEEVFRHASQNQRIILTFDLDFGRMYYLRFRGETGVIILRIKPQTVENANETLKRLHVSGFFQSPDLQKALVVVGKRKVRISMLR